MTGFVPPPYPYDRLGEVAATRRHPRRRSGRPLDRYAVRPATARGHRGTRARDVGPRLPAVDRYRCATRSRRSLDAAAARRDRRPGHAARRVCRDQGVRRLSAAAIYSCAIRLATRSSTRSSATRRTRWGPRWPGCAQCLTRGSPTSTRRTPAAPSRCGSTRRATRPGSSATWPRPRPGAARAAFRCCRTSATPSSPGRPDRRRSCGQAQPVCLPCTRCPSATTSPAPASASTPATRSLSRICAKCASTPASCRPDRFSTPRSWRSTTTRTSSASASDTPGGSSDSAMSCGACGYPASLPDGAFYLWVAVPSGDAWAAALRPRSAGRHRRVAGRVLRANRHRPLPGRGGSAGRAHRPGGPPRRRLTASRTNAVMLPTNFGHTISRMADVFDGYRRGPAWDEMIDADRLRPRAIPSAVRLDPQQSARRSCAAGVGRTRPFLPQSGRDVRRRR